MSQALCSAYVGFAKLLADAGYFITPAELQGNLWGVKVSGGSFQEVDMATLLGEGEESEAIKLAISGLQEMVNKEFTDGSVTVTLLLPTDDESLDERLKALINWADGFLSGFGMVKQTAPLPKEVLEILADLDSVTQLQTTIAPEDEARSENDYMELVEFLKLVPLLVATELKNLPDEKQVIH